MNLLKLSSCLWMIVTLSFTFLGSLEGSAPQVDLTLPVAVLPTSLALPGMKLHYPAEVRTRVPAHWSGVLSAYGAIGTVIIASKGWTREGSMGVDGSATVTLIRKQHRRCLLAT